jgi:hypothetical protein
MISTARAKREVKEVAVLADVVDDHDVLVHAAGGGAGLDAEALGADHPARGEDLEGDEPAQADVTREVDRAHAALPEAADELVVGDATAELGRDDALDRRGRRLGRMGREVDVR